jgi:hypothetical protein
VEACRAAGYRQFLTKPVPFGEVQKAIEALRPRVPVALGGEDSP